MQFLMKLFRWNYKDIYILRVVKAFGLQYFAFIFIGGFVFSIMNGVDKGMLMGIGGGLLITILITLLAL